MELKRIAEMDRLRYSTDYTFSTLKATDDYTITEVMGEGDIYMYATYFQVGEHFYRTTIFFSQVKVGKPILNTRKLILTDDEKTSRIKINTEVVHFEKSNSEQQIKMIETTDNFIHFILHLPAYRIKSIVEAWEWQYQFSNKFGYKILNWEEIKENSVQGGAYGTTRSR